MIQVAIPHLNANGEMEYLEIWNTSMNSLGGFYLDGGRITGWHYEKSPGINYERFNDTPISPGSAGSPVLLSVEGDGDHTFFKDKKGLFKFLPNLFRVFGH
jgi:hypothetical protein